MTVNEIYEYLDTVIPKSLRCDWDNDGLMVCSDPGREVKKVLITLDCTDDAVSYADEIAKMMNIPVRFTCAPEALAPELEGKVADLFPLRIQKLYYQLAEG